ncbi:MULTISPECIES: type 1 glutamine amidotransferase [unclassified Micromonospora]|uniref:type 1 glutamine amidotransferase n=1 Tax=unclassified Micromonospora TaxID=2617518 RepID=UPI001051EC02|nr:MULTISPECIES: type 1 glutamine amidotransferase [unclassified Micromonospora]TDB78005.1 type 1 glutamine amidotransferase [Micromonospora sp. KC721]TDC40988.1 type 1 glutamine amidotransferase [Micromonospora sp. KC213]
MATALVIENDPADDLRRLGEWLTEGGLELRVLRPYAGDELPADLTGYAALVVLGGEPQAHPLPDGTPGAPWFPAVEGLLRKAVRHRVPTLGVCLGGQLLATAHAGQVERSSAGPEIGPGVVGKRDAADNDPLFRYVPLIPDVLQWHVDEITELPRGATLLAASTRYPHQAFRLGDRAWGLQFHIECDTAMIADWARDSTLLAELGYDPELVVAACDRVMADVEEVWQPFAIRFAALALGELDDVTVRPQLPLLGH